MKMNCKVGKKHIMVRLPSKGGSCEGCWFHNARPDCPRKSVEDYETLECDDMSGPQRFYHFLLKEI